MSNDGNRIASQNGKFAERMAEKIIETQFGKFVFINDIVDFRTETGVYIEIKSCQQTIQSANPKYPNRIGRFNLNKPQHTFLIAHDGYYIFIIKKDEMVMRSMVIPAKMIPFKRLLIWKHLFAENDKETPFNALSPSGHIDTASTIDNAQIPLKRDYVDETSRTDGE
jgi:hypothetical protein